MKVLEAHSILCAVRYAVARTPPESFMTIWRWCCCSAEDARKNHNAFSHASYLCVWLLGRFCLIFQVDIVRVESFLQGKSVFDCDHDTSKSLVHVLSQRLRSLPSPTCDQSCLPPSWMDLDIGKADLTSHTHVPAMSVQSCHNRMISLLHWTCCGCFISKLFSFFREMVAQRSCLHGSSDVVWATPCLFGSQFLDESQIRWSSFGSSAKARHAQGLVNINQNFPSCLISGPSSGHKRPSRVRPCQEPAIRCLRQVVAT